MASLRHLTTPFADAGIGAVSGRVVVLDTEGILGRTLQVQHTLTFDFGRAAQATYRTVACCPGVLSVFGRTLILPHLPAWLSQRFLVRQVSHGEDQAPTNIVVRQGFDTVYQRQAVVHTLTPTRYLQLCKMFTRWDRSTIVEGVSFATSMFSDYHTSNRVLPALVVCLGVAVLWHKPTMLDNLWHRIFRGCDLLCHVLSVD